MPIDYTSIFILIVDVIQSALPIGLAILLTERLISIFIKMVFGKWEVG
jgi:hypothetical protein